MKKLFTLLAMLIMALSASAAKLNLSLDNLGTGWGSTYDAATHTITFEDVWKGRGWWFDSADYSAYDEVYVEFEAVTCSVQLVVEYNGTDASSKKIANAGETSVSVTLDPSLKKDVKQIYLQTSAACSLTLKDAYVYKEGDIELPKTKDILNDFKAKGTFENGVLTITSAADWGWFDHWYGDNDFNDFDYLVLELAEPADIDVQVVIAPVTGDNTSAMLNAGKTILYIPLPKTKNHVKQIALQNAAPGEFKVGALYLVSTTIKIKEAGYATYVPAINLDFEGSDVTAYAVEADVENAVAHLTPVSQVPTAKAIVVKGAPGAYTLPAIYSAEDFDTDLEVSDNDITYSDTYTYYYLGVDNGTVGFRPLAQNGNIVAGKCFFKVDNAAGAKFLNISFGNSDVTSIQNVKKTISTGSAYNLAGQRVAENTKGIVVINGKKFINK